MANKEKKIDEVDKSIIKILQVNARTTASDIAESVGMSVPAISERLRKLESSGVVDRYTVILDNEKLGKDIMSVMLVALDAPNEKNSSSFREMVRSEVGILECFSVTGEFDYQLKIVTSSTASLEDLIRKIKAATGGAKTNTSIVMSTVKLSFPIELD